MNTIDRGHIVCLSHKYLSSNVIKLHTSTDEPDNVLKTANAPQIDNNEWKLPGHYKIERSLYVSDGLQRKHATIVNYITKNLGTDIGNGFYAINEPDKLAGLFEMVQGLILSEVSPPAYESISTPIYPGTAPLREITQQKNATNVQKTKLDTEKKPKRSVKDLSLYFNDNQRIRHVITKDNGKSEWIGCYSSQDNAIIYSGDKYTLASFASKHNERENIIAKFEKAWNKCEVEVNGEWCKAKTIEPRDE